MGLGGKTRISFSWNATAVRVVIICIGASIILPLVGCNWKASRPIIAVIPRTTGVPLWDVERAGVADVARAARFEIYWNAPMSDDDVSGQISLLERAKNHGWSGLIVNPIATNPLRIPILRLIEQGTPVVVVGADLGIPPSQKLAYVLNDDSNAGKLAAQRLNSILHGKGRIAIVGFDKSSPNALARERSFSETLREQSPNIQVQRRSFGYSTVAQEQAAVTEILVNEPPLDGIVALTGSSTRGAYYALLAAHKERLIKLIGFDQDMLPPLRTGGLDSVVAQNTYEMGRLAMTTMERLLNDGSIPATQTVAPVLITQKNLDSPEIQALLYRP